MSILILPTCPDDCSGLPAVDFDICAPELHYGEVAKVYLAAADADDFTNVEDLAEWTTRLDDSATATGDEIRTLTVIGELPEPEQTELTIQLVTGASPSFNSSGSFLIDSSTIGFVCSTELITNPILYKIKAIPDTNSIDCVLNTQSQLRLSRGGGSSYYETAINLDSSGALFLYSDKELATSYLAAQRIDIGA